MLWILDTNHYREFERGSVKGEVIKHKLIKLDALAGITVATAEEVVRGRLARIQPHQQVDRGVESYGQFKDSLEGFANIMILPWTSAAADIFDLMVFQRLRIGTMDLRIASMALVYDAVILTRNLVDFEKVPGLQVENWLD